MREKQIEMAATLANLEPVLGVIETFLTEARCPIKEQMQIAVAAEEIYVNIARYAYAPQTGNMTLRLQLVDNPTAAILSFYDTGRPYNPLARKDPDVESSIDDRPIGGLGIYMVKQTMDEVTYQYVQQQNVLTFRKNFTPED